MFFALKGENFDGNQYAKQALASGAKWAIVDDANLQNSDNITVVPDVLQALQELAKYHRSQFDIPVVGITGTNGKTTTKELIQAVLEQKFNLIATRGNYNNHIGVPLTLLRISDETELAIIEMGANHQGEIGYLSNLANPTHGIITNIGKAHLEGFGSYEIVRSTKNELYKHIIDHNGTIILNHDDEVLMELSEKASSRIFYGKSGDFLGTYDESNGMLSVEWKGNDGKNNQISTQLYGAYNFYNVMAAVSVGTIFDVPATKINEALANYTPSNNRSQLINKGNNTIYLDAYNANPVSMSAALNFFEKLKSDNKIVILGDMFELGEDSLQEHKQILNQLKDIDLKDQLVVGKEFYNFKDEYSFRFFEETKDLLNWASENHPENSALLIKGSRGMKLEQVLDYI